MLQDCYFAPVSRRHPCFNTIDYPKHWRLATRLTGDYLTGVFTGVDNSQELLTAPVRNVPPEFLPERSYKV